MSTDDEKYEITEWIRLFGPPGRKVVDANGRIYGYFPTEPDYCEDTIIEDES